MILRTPGDEFQYNGILYKIGEPIIGTEQSEYEGLIGSIVAITDGEDKRTENSTPDFYCCFDPPVLPYDIKQLEEIFSDLYDFPKTLEDIILDYVIMAPRWLFLFSMQENRDTGCRFISYRKIGRSMVRMAVKNISFPMKKTQKMSLQKS